MLWAGGTQESPPAGTAASLCLQRLGHLRPKALLPSHHKQQIKAPFSTLEKDMKLCLFHHTGRMAVQTELRPGREGL